MFEGLGSLAPKCYVYFVLSPAGAGLILLLVCNQNIRFVFCDFRREAEIAKNKTGPGPNGPGPKGTPRMSFNVFQKPPDLFSKTPRLRHQALRLYGGRRLLGKRKLRPREKC